MSAEETMMHAVHARDVEKRYGDNLVLDNLDLSLPPGEFCSLVGPSGCGKTTLLRTILGQEFVTDGALLINGRAAGFPDETRGVVFQKYMLFPNRTVLENVMMGRVSKVSPVKRLMNPTWWREECQRYEAEAYEYLRRVRIDDSAHKYPRELSGGMQQRVAIARALVPQPKILLMDEPFGALDRGTRRDAQLFLIELWEQLGMTVLFITHDLDEAIFLSSRLVVLSQHYTDDRGDNAPRGAKIVIDHDFKPGLDDRHSMGFDRYVTKHLDLIEEIDERGMNPLVRQHVRDFRLDDPSSWRTLSPDEVHPEGG